MEQFKNNFNTSPHEKNDVENIPETEVYVPAFHVQQEALAMYGIKVKEPEEGSYDREGTIEDPPRPPGRCWTIEHDRPRLIACLGEPP